MGNSAAGGSQGEPGRRVGSQFFPPLAPASGWAQTFVPGGRIGEPTPTRRRRDGGSGQAGPLSSPLRDSSSARGALLSLAYASLGLNQEAAGCDG